MAQRRSDIVDAGNPGVYHCVSRCVRRESLLDDPARRAWILHRLQFLANWMAVDVISFAIMRNHVHLLLAIRPDVAAEWSDREVAERRVAVMPNRRWRARHGIPADAPPSSAEVNAILHCPRRLAVARTNLSSLGFFHRLLKEPCARLWNKVDGVTGHFWEGRFKSPRVLDLEALVHVARYIELNEVHAGSALSVPGSAWTSASVQWERLVAIIEETRTRCGDEATPEFIADQVARHEWAPVFSCRAGAFSAGRAPPDPPGPPDPSSVEGRHEPDRNWAGTALGFRSCEVRLAAFLDSMHVVGQRPHPRKRGRIASSGEGPLAAAFRAAIRDIRADRRPMTAIRTDGSAPPAETLFECALRMSHGDQRCSLDSSALPMHASVFAVSRGTCYGAEDSVRREAERRGRDRLWVGYGQFDDTAA